MKDKKKYFHFIASIPFLKQYNMYTLCIDARNVYNFIVQRDREQLLPLHLVERKEEFIPRKETSSSEEKW